MNNNVDEEGQEDYSEFSRDQLIEEIKKLKQKCRLSFEDKKIRLRNSQEEEKIHSSSNGKKEKDVQRGQDQTKGKIKQLNFQDYSQRKIALTVCYQGTSHGGLAWQPEVTRLSTVEGELFKALLISRLVERNKTGDHLGSPDFNQPEHLIQSVDLEKWGYSRAGRTDAGVSGSGQVISLWVRSRLKSSPSRFGFRRKEDVNKKPIEQSQDELDEEEEQSIEDELRYHTILNSILPNSVRVLAWSPVSEQFDARFSCQARHYKYFFSLYENPLGPPLNIQAMREAAEKLIGEHDFRNFCRIDPSKQINNFNRKILLAQINSVQQADGLVEEFSHNHSYCSILPVKTNSDLDSSRPAWVQSNPMFVLDLMGTAFLYNMVRHIVSILFLIGSGLESVDLIDRMFYTQPSNQLANSIEHRNEMIESKPEYVHANALPLLFYRSIYPDGTFEWIPTPSQSIKPSSSDLFTAWSKDRLRTLISYHHLKAHNDFLKLSPNLKSPSCSSFYQPLGAAELRPSTRYVPVLERPRAPHFSVTNANWWNKIGAQKLAKRQLL